jgi:subtilisin family serine protease
VDILNCQIISLGYMVILQSLVGRVVFVAAAGNDSGNAPGGPVHELAQVPADFGLVIGVAATTVDGQRPTCYTNIGHVAAPGGDGRDLSGTIPPPTGTPETCAPVAKVDCHDAQCPYGLMSLVTTQDPITEPGFAYWSGTSFATPLVSGMAARLLSMTNVSAFDVVLWLKQPMAAGGYACPPSGTPTPDSALGAGVAQIDGTCP